MTEAETLHPHGGDFNRFLYASVGQDRNGYVVTVLSALARLGLDPWKEAGELAALGRDAAGARLEKLLARFHDVPALSRNEGAIARHLTLLLPERPVQRAAKFTGALTTDRSAVSRGVIVAVLMILLVLAQVLLSGTPSAGQ